MRAYVTTSDYPDFLEEVVEEVVVIDVRSPYVLALPRLDTRHRLECKESESRQIRSDLRAE